MAERHTVDVDVVGSKPIRHPEEPPCAEALNYHVALGEE